MIGFKELLLILTPTTWVAGAIGIWLFYVQHQFEDVYWSNNEEWNYISAGLEGSSYYKLPKVLQWFSGNIGIHHIHHLSSLIPNYNLEKCMKENPILSKYVTQITFMESLKTVSNKLWSEELQKMISWKEYNNLQQLKLA